MIVGFDYASVDGNRPPNLVDFQAACARAGSRAGFAIFRACWGTQPDLTVQRDWHRAIDAGLICGAYLFLRLPHQGFKGSPEDQVHVFADNMGSLTERDLVPTVDVEDTGLPAEQELEWVHRAWQAMREIYGVPPMLYTSDRVWREDLHNLPAGAMVDSPLWLAKPWPQDVRTPAQLGGDRFASGKLDPVVPQPWGAGNWWIHQYQGDAYPAPGFTSTVDINRFRLMRIGESGARVAWVQRRLRMPSGTPAVFDGDMMRRVRAFQSDRHLVVDGVIGPATFAKLSWCAPSA